MSSVVRGINDTVRLTPTYEYSECNNYGQCERMLRYTSLDPARVSMSRSWVLENRQMAFRCQTTTICLGNKTIYAYALPSFRFLR